MPEGLADDLLMGGWWIVVDARADGRFNILSQKNMQVQSFFLALYRPARHRRGEVRTSFVAHALSSPSQSFDAG